MTTYTAADRYISSRTNLPTSLSSVEISAEFSAKVRAQSFFSARVAEASILEKLRDLSDAYSRGETNLAQARTDAKLMLAKSGLGYVPSGTSDLSDLGGTARLDLILRQNSAMAHAVGQREVSLDPDIVERFPYFRYIARDGARSSHAVLDNLVLPKTDPFWHTHTPPWDFNCRCGIEDCDAEEAARYGGVDKAIDRGDGSYALTVNGTPVNLMPNASGYEFDVNEALGSCDMSRIKSPDARAAVVNAAEIEFGDRLEVKNNVAKVRGIPYPTFADHQLPSAREWTDIPVAPTIINHETAMSMIKTGVDVTAADGRKVNLGQALLDHWNAEEDKLTNSVIGRLEHLPWAIDTLEHPRERWDQDTQSVYLQAYDQGKGSKKYRGCMVTVTKDGNARTYFLQEMKAIDKCRKGKSHEKF